MEYLKSSKSQHCYSTKLFTLFISAVLCLPLCQLLLVLFNWKDPLHCWNLGCTVSSSLISAVLCLHPSSQRYCVFISANYCWCSSIGRIYCIIGILAVLCLHYSSRLYCVFILHLSCTVPSSFISPVLCLQLCQLLLVLFNWKDLLHCWDLGCTVSSYLPTVAGVPQLEGSTALLPTVTSGLVLSVCVLFNCNWCTL